MSNEAVIIKTGNMNKIKIVLNIAKISKFFLLCIIRKIGRFVKRLVTFERL